MKLPTLLGLLDNSILEADTGSLSLVKIYKHVATDLREEIMGLALTVASLKRTGRELVRENELLQHSLNSYGLAFELLEASMNAEIGRQKIYATELGGQLDLATAERTEAAAPLDLEAQIEADSTALTDALNEAAAKGELL